MTREGKDKPTRAGRDRVQPVLVAALMALVLAGCVAPQSVPLSETAAGGWKGDPLGVPDRAQASQGRRIAQSRCASCHAIGEHGSSPTPGAPPLRDILALYEADNLAYRFIEGMRVGHDDMPVFDFDVHAADALIAYIREISGGE